MSLVNKLTKNLRWLRWSTICAILFYMFFIGLILHSTTYKLQHTLKSRRHQQQQPPEQPALQQQHAAKHFSAAHGNNVLQAPPALPTALPSLKAGLRVRQGDKRGIGKFSSRHDMRNSNNFPATHTEDKTKIGAAHKTASALQSGTNVAGGVHAIAAGNAVGAVQGKAREPETLILAASSVNEKQILEKAFNRADKNKDSQLTIQELAVYINKKIVDHIEEAIQLNPREFRQVDISPADGLITWDEYHRFFLKEHGMTDDDIDEHDEIKHTALNRKAREDMMRDKARWTEAARTDLFSLTIDEYLSFRHPESSISNLLELVDDLLRQFDQDGDDQLSIEEFSDVTMNDDDDLIRKSLISRTVVERRAEFERILDKNHDGRADREELLHYVNPKTPRYALQDAATLFSLCDENKDGKLTLDELIANAEIILTSKMIDTANSFHTEF